MLLRLLLIVYIFIFSFLFVAPVPAHAQAWGGCVKNGIATLQCIPTVFNNLVKGALMFAGATAVLLIIWAGIQFARSGGDQKQVQSARNIITYALIGLVLVLSSFAIIFFISYLTGAKCITNLSFTSCQ